MIEVLEKINMVSTMAAALGFIFNMFCIDGVSILYKVPIITLFNINSAGLVLEIQDGCQNGCKEIFYSLV